MKVYPHFWHDEGNWSLDANEWKEKNLQAVEIDDEIIDNYKKAKEQLEVAHAALTEAIREAGYKQGSVM